MSIQLKNALPRELIADASQGHLGAIKDYLAHNKKFNIDSKDVVSLCMLSHVLTVIILGLFGL